MALAVVGVLSLLAIGLPIGADAAGAAGGAGGATNLSGGNGGSGNGQGGSAGVSAVVPGLPGATASVGVGGAGGDSVFEAGGAGGARGAFASATPGAVQRFFTVNGQDGAHNGNIFTIYGAGGGGGGAALYLSGVGFGVIDTIATGGAGGNGADGLVASGGGGGGGAGLESNGTGSITLSNLTLTGGAGGSGGGGGGGGGGGSGLYLTGLGVGITVNGSSFFGGAGGAGGSGGLSGQGGNGGEGGAAVMLTNGTLTVSGSGGASVFTGGVGGAGGGSDGGGGNGGVGVYVGGGWAIIDNATVTGGDGGTATGGQAGAGGAGVVLRGSGVAVQVRNGASVSGGNGGSSVSGSGGAGGVGIVLDHGVAILAGRVSGGLGSDGVTRADALLFNGASNAVTIAPTASLIGNMTLSAGSNASVTLDSTTQAFTLDNGIVLDTGANLSLSNVATGNAVTLSGAISGVGGLSKAGTGLIVLSGANTYSGNTTVSAGTLQLGASNALSAASNLSVASGATVDLNGYSQTAASLAGQGNVDLHNADFRVGAGNGDTVFGGVISGNGNITKQGSGLLVLSGANTYSGLTGVSGGTLQVDGAIAGAVFVQQDAVLSGSGRVGSVSVSAGGTLAADTAGAGLTVNGDVYFSSGSSYRAAFAPGAAGRIDINGNLSVDNGATLKLVAAAGSYAAGSTYRIASFSGSRSGSFSSVLDNFAFVTPTLTYGSNSIDVTLNASGGFQSSGFNLAAGAPNQQAVATALTRIYQAGGNVLTNTLMTASTAEAQRALASLGGEATGAATVNAANNLAQGQDAIGQRLAAVDATVAGTATSIDADPWISVSAGQQRLASSSSGASGYSNRSYILAFGHDHALTQDWLAGFAFAANSDSLSYRDVSGSARSNGLQASAYARYRPQGSVFYAKGMLSYGWQHTISERQLALGTLSARTRGSFNVHSAGLYGETGASLALASVELEPYAGLALARIHRPAYAESTQSGSDAFALRYQAADSNQAAATLGLRLRHVAAEREHALTWQGDFAWRHRFGADAGTLTAAFVNASGVDFTVRGVAQARDEAIANVGLSYAIDATTAAFGRASATLGRGYQAVGATVGVRWWW